MSALTEALALAELIKQVSPSDRFQPEEFLLVLADEVIRLRSSLERIQNFPIHSEPVGGAYAMQDIARDAFEQQRLKPASVQMAVNACCSCGGKGPDDGCCQACEVWHRLQGRIKP